MYSEEIRTKARDLLQRMTLEQKIGQMQCVMNINGAVTEAAAPHGLGEVSIMMLSGDNEALKDAIDSTYRNMEKVSCGAPPFIHNEALTGLSNAEATVFPTALGLGATFNPDVVREAGEVIHDQAKALGYSQLFAPVLDVCRDPRWGRIGETYGEDPTLSAMLGVSFVNALQGPENDRLCATGKHFLGYGAGSGGLNMASAQVPYREIREVYAKPFQAAITEGGLMSVMNSYGTIDGEMVIGSKRILTDLLRKEMEFEGITVSDYGSVEHLVDHRLATDNDEAGRMALHAGLDVECPQPVGYRTENLLNSARLGLISEEEIDRSVLRILEAKIACGMTEHPGSDPARQSSFHSKAADRAAMKAARESVVLLKNDGTLPLKKESIKIALIGPHADSIRLLYGGYTAIAGLDMVVGGSLGDQAGMPSVSEMETLFHLSSDKPVYPGSTVEKENELAQQLVLQIYGHTPTIRSALKEINPNAEIVCVKGCDVAGEDRSGFDAAISAASAADVVIMTMGGKYGWGGSCTIGEGIDADDIRDLGAQNELAELLCETGKPVIILHMNARPFSNPAVAEKANAILELWFPGSTGGRAAAEVLYGDYNPAGRLPATAARSVGQIPVYCGQYPGNSYHVHMTPTSSSRYVDSTVDPLYCFGHGLSYTTFEYSDLQVSSKEVSSDGEVSISCHVANTGSVDGDEVVQLYAEDDCSSMMRPALEFAGARRIHLKAGESKRICFTVRADQFAFIGKDDEWIVEAGSMTVRIGGSSADLPLKGQFSITDTRKIRPAKRGFFAKTSVV